MEPTYMFSCLREGAKYTKKGRGSIQKQVAATLQVKDNKVLLNKKIPKDIKKLTEDPDKPVYIDVSLDLSYQATKETPRDSLK